MKMADEFDAQKAFLTWEESAEILLIDASHGIARAQRLLAIRYLRGRGVSKDEDGNRLCWYDDAGKRHEHSGDFLDIRTF